MSKNKLTIFLLIKLVLALMLIPLSSVQMACGTAYSELSPEDPRINQGMKDYYEAKAIAFAQGKYFEAKLLQCVKLKVHNTTYYHYGVIIAPRSGMPLYSFSMIFLPPPELLKYFTGGVEMPPFDPMESVEKLWPIENRFTWTNYGDEVQQKAGISGEVFDEQMRTLRMEVHFNDKTETLSLSIELPFTEVSGINDPLVQNNRFLQAIYEKNLCYAHQGGYLK